MHAAFTRQQLRAIFFVLRGHGGKLIGLEGVASKRRRLQRKGLSGPALFPFHITRRHGPLFHPVDGFSGAAVKNVQQGCLAYFGDGWNLSPVARNVEQDGRRTGIVIPRIMVNGLEIPFQFAGLCVQSNKTVAEEIRAFAIATVVIVSALTEGHIDDAALDIDGHHAPHVGAGAIFPAIAFPGIVADLAGLWDGVKLPD